MTYLTIRSRHKSVEPLRKTIPVPVKRAVYRHGSTTEGDFDYEVNTVESVKNSSSKLRMKTCFSKAGITTACWWTIHDYSNVMSLKGEVKCISELKYPVVLKHIMGSRNTGNRLMKEYDNLRSALRGINAEKWGEYIIEKFHGYSKEYRLHVTSEGCFYACRKMLRNGTPDHQKWYRNDSNSVWITEENPKFEKPSNWAKIETECIKALSAVGLDVGGFDVRVQSEKGEEPKFIIIESNSGCSLKKIGLDKYSQILPKILATKYKLNPCVV